MWYSVQLGMFWVPSLQYPNTLKGEQIVPTFTGRKNYFVPCLYIVKFHLFCLTGSYFWPVTQHLLNILMASAVLVYYRFANYTCLLVKEMNSFIGHFIPKRVLNWILLTLYLIGICKSLFINNTWLSRRMRIEYLDENWKISISFSCFTRNVHIFSASDHGIWLSIVLFMRSMFLWFS